MLYVFHVDTGTMLTFDMNFALESVSKLREVINRFVRVPPDKQVLLISGGEALESHQRVCQYSAGTDTNPIFLFSKNTIECQQPPSPSIDCESDTDLKEQVDGALNMPASYNTVVARAQLAHQFHEYSSAQVRKCQQLVHDQHLQQQGWAAVIANLEDIAFAFKARFERFEQSYNEFSLIKEEKIKILENFEEDIKLLSKIPVLPALLGKAWVKEKPVLTEENESCVEKNDCEELEEPKSMSLLEWISAKDSNSDVQEIAQLSFRGLEQITDNMLSQLAAEVASACEEASRPCMKEIKGLEERLFSLETMMHECNKIVQEQNNYAQALYQNQTRASKVNDPSIFPDLCTSHRKNLMDMYRNYQKIQNIKTKCFKAKEELSENLHARLKWVMFVENRMSGLDDKLNMYRESLRRLKNLLQVVDQIHQAPRVYVSAITEVARRHAFSSAFIEWATALSAESGEVWEKEVITRKQFIQQFSSHFLANLFPGLDDIPPDFAAKPPDKFDEKLPKLTRGDIEQLRAVLPELASLLIVGEVIAVPPLLQVALKSQLTNSPTPSSGTFVKEGSGDIYASAVTTANSITPRNTPERENDGRNNSLRPASLNREQQESETDTEEFEKVGCSGGSDGTFSPMETTSDGRSSLKNKQHFSTSHVNDSKHIKLDGGHQSPLLSELPSDDISYTESNGTSGTTGSSSRHMPPLVKTHHVITAELQKQLEDKNSAIITLQNDLSRAKDEVERLHQRLSALASLDCKDVISNLKLELASLRDKVKDDGASYLSYISELSSRLLDVLLQIQVQTSADQSAAVTEAVSQVRADQNKLQEQLRGTLDLQTHKLSDAHKEIEIYQEQLQRNQQNLQQTVAEFEEVNRGLIEEKAEAVKHLTLEHELEMVALKEKWQEEDTSRLEEVSSLREKLHSLQESIEKAQTERSDLEKNFQDQFDSRIQEEKDKVIHILEVSFSEREKKALVTLKEQLQDEHKDELSRLLREKDEAIQASCEEVRCHLVEEWRQVVEAQHLELSEKHNQNITKLKEEWESEKVKEIELKIAEIESRLRDERASEIENVRQQYKMELDGLRSRFRMMTTASMDKSPSETSLEKFEKGEFLDITTHELNMARLREDLEKEKEAALESAKMVLQEQFSVMQQEQIQKHEEMRKEERRKIEAEKQIVFNDAIKSVSQDKERVIEDLRLRVELLTDESDKLRRMIHNATHESSDHIMTAIAGENPVVLKERCELYEKDIQRLENELARAKRISFISDRHPDLSMSFTDGGNTSGNNHDDIRRLQMENQELRDKLTRSATSLVERGKINVHSCQMGDAVLLVWDEYHLHYRVFLESNPHLHFLHTESYGPLQLSKEAPRKLYCTAEVVVKEFCQAKKDENRFRVSKGTKFYRVSCKPWEGDDSSRRETTNKPHRLVESSSSTSSGGPHTSSSSSPTVSSTSVSVSSSSLSSSAITNVSSNSSTVVTSPGRTQSSSSTQ